MKLTRTNQKGFTLIEIVIALGIFGLVIAAATGTIAQVFQSARSSDHMNALRQVQSAGYWVSKDGIQAQTITTQGYLLYVARTDYDDSELHEIVYSLQDMPSGGLKQLQREEWLNGTPTYEIVVSRYIDPDQTSCSWNASAKALTFTVTATMNQQTETRTYEVQPRPST